MRIIRGLEQLGEIKNPVITIGSFDGIHKAHQKIFRRINSIAQQIDGESVVVTFDPHPREIIYPKDKTLQLITSTNEKIKLLESLDIDVCLLIPFSFEFSQQDPKEYVEKFLIKKISPRFIVIGYDHRFGLNRAGDFSMLKQYEKEGAFKLVKIDELEIDEMTVSSTKVRNHLLAGEIEKANNLLGYSFELNGTVVSGEKIGRDLGYPTANLQLNTSNKLVPASGIYASEVIYNSKSYSAMLYIGRKPTINKENTSKKFIEVNILDFEGDIYNQQVRIQILKRIRDEEQFDNKADLVKAIRNDETTIRAFFERRHNTINREPSCRISILNYNGVQWFEKYLNHVLYSSSYPFILSVIDNASTDNSIEYLSKYKEQIDIIPLEENFGFARGYNLGLQNVFEKYIVFLNSDVRVTTNWLNPIIEMMDKDETIGIVQPKILSDRKPDTFEHAGAAGGFIDALGFPFCRGRVFDICEKDLGQYDDESEIFWASGAAMVVRSSVWNSLGGFDGNFYAHMEEIDFCWRAKRAGVKVMYCPSSAVYHYGGGTLAYGDPKKVYLNFRNNLNMLIKNESLLKRLWVLPMRLVLDGAAGLKFLLERNFKAFASVIKAYFSVYSSLFKTLKTAKNDALKIEQLKGNNSIHDNRYKGSIVIQYFLNKKRTFNQIIK